MIFKKHIVVYSLQDFENICKLSEKYLLQYVTHALGTTLLAACRKSIFFT